MKLLLSLFLLFTTIAQAQDTVYNVKGFTRVTNIYNYLNNHKNVKFDTVDFKGSFLKMERRGDVYYLPKPLADTLLRITSNTNFDTQTIKIECAPYDTTISRFIESIAFKNGVVGFYLRDYAICKGEQLDQLYLYYPERTIMEAGVPARFFDYKIVSVIIDIVRKQSTYSN